MLSCQLCNSVIRPAVSYAVGLWMWNAAQQSRIYAVETSCRRGTCCVSGWEGESNKSVYAKFGMGMTVKGEDCGVME